MREFVTFKKYKSQDDALELIEVLASNNISYESENIELAYSDATITGGLDFQDKVAIKIKSIDFEKANALLEELAAKSVEWIDEGHYLYGFSDEELMEVVGKFDEWSETDVLLAQMMLKDREKELSKSEIQQLKESRLTVLRKPESGYDVGLVFGYFCVIMGGIVGIGVGYHFRNFKKQLPNGERIFAYDMQSRTAGSRMMFIGVVALLFWAIIGWIYAQ